MSFQAEKLFITAAIIVQIIIFTWSAGVSKAFAQGNYGVAASKGTNTGCLKVYAVDANKIKAMESLNKAVYFILNASGGFYGTEIFPLSFKIRIINKNKKNYFLAEQYISVDNESMTSFIAGRLKGSVEVIDNSYCLQSRNAMIAVERNYKNNENNYPENTNKYANTGIISNLGISIGFGNYPYPYYYPFYYPFYPYFYPN